jgi:hypothetical protein
MVDLVGFEPTTSSMPWKRAPNCATGPYRRDTTIFAHVMNLVKRLNRGRVVIYEKSENRYAVNDIGMKLGSASKYVCFSILFSALAVAQAPSQASAPAAPVPYSSVSELNLLLSQLEQTSQATQLDLAKLRIEKWKTDGNTKRATQQDVESLQRNMQNALPEIVARLRSSPENLATTFELYRNLDALYGVFSSVVESAGAFGSRDEFQILQNDLSALERARRSFADRMDTLANAKEGELAHLRTQVQTLEAAQQAAAPPPKKTVVDDTEPPKKAVKKKPSTKSTKPATTGTQQKSSPGSDSKQQMQPPNPQSPPQ